MRGILLALTICIASFGLGQEVKLGIQEGHEEDDVIHFLNKSSSERFYVSGGENGILKLWESRTDRLLKTIYTGNRSVVFAKFLNDSIIQYIRNDGRVFNYGLKSNEKTLELDCTFFRSDAANKWIARDWQKQTYFSEELQILVVPYTFDAYYNISHLFVYDLNELEKSFILSNAIFHGFNNDFNSIFVQEDRGQVLFKNYNDAVDDWSKIYKGRSEKIELYLEGKSVKNVKDESDFSSWKSISYNDTLFHYETSNTNVNIVCKDSMNSLFPNKYEVTLVRENGKSFASVISIDNLNDFENAIICDKYIYWYENINEIPRKLYLHRLNLRNGAFEQIKDAKNGHFPSSLKNPILIDNALYFSFMGRVLKLNDDSNLEFIYDYKPKLNLIENSLKGHVNISCQGRNEQNRNNGYNWKSREYNRDFNTYHISEFNFQHPNYILDSESLNFKKRYSESNFTLFTCGEIYNLEFIRKKEKVVLSLIPLNSRDTSNWVILDSFDRSEYFSLSFSPQVLNVNKDSSVILLELTGNSIDSNFDYVERVYSIDCNLKTSKRIYNYKGYNSESNRIIGMYTVDKNIYTFFNDLKGERVVQFGSTIESENSLIRFKKVRGQQLFTSTKFLRNSKQIISVSEVEKQVAVIWNVEDGKIEQTLNVPMLDCTSNDISDQEILEFKVNLNESIILLIRRHSIDVFKRGKKKFFFQKRYCFQDAINSAAILNDSIMLLLKESNLVEKFNYENGESIIKTVLLTSNEKVDLLEDKYYMCSKKNIGQLFFTKGLKSFPFSQFDLIFNRPDLVLEKKGGQSKNVIKQYRRAYEKRLQKMGFTEDMLKADFHLPEASILNEGELPVQIEGETLKLNIKATDSKYRLDRINVWINNVPIYGVNGISLRDKNTQDYKTEIVLQLNEGDNKIEVSVLNQSGAESYKETVYINCTKRAPKPNLYLVGVGVKEYENQDMNLKFSDKDIRDIAHLYGKNKSYDTVYIDTFLNASATKNILPQIRQRLESTTIHDQVIFMYSGHGILDDSLDYYLTTHDIDFLNPKGKGIPYEAVDELLDNIAARQKLVLIDACNSGEVDKDEMEVDNTTGITAEVVAPKGDMFKKYATKTNSFEMMQELFTDLRRGTGATVISSSSGKYFSFEDKKYQNGVYTYALKLGLEGAADANDDNEITVSELKEFLYTKVESLTNGRQKPTARQENLEYDFRVW